MQLEELREFRNQARAQASGEKNKEEKDRQGRPSQRNDRRRDNRDRPIRFSRYTPLTTEREDSGRGPQRRVNPFSKKSRQPKQCRPEEAVSVSPKQRALDRGVSGSKRIRLRNLSKLDTSADSSVTAETHPSGGAAQANEVATTRSK